METFLTVFDIEDWRVKEETPVAPATPDSDLQRLVDVFAEVYNEAAESRGWCSEAEEVTRRANVALARAGFSVTLPERQREYEGYLDVPLSVYVRMPFSVLASKAADSEQIREAIEAAYNADPRSSDEVLRAALEHGYVTGSSDYSLGMVAVEWAGGDIEEYEGDWRYA